MVHIVNNPDVRIYPDLDALSRAAALSVVEQISSRLATGSGTFSLVLSGGSTPRSLYRLLATDFRERIPWQRVHLFWGDERYVLVTDARSNYRMAQEALIAHIPIPPQNVHPMPSDLPNPEDAARSYEEILRAHFGSSWPRFDLVLLGLGQEGHTASLFPASPALDETERWVVAVRTPADPPLRLTLTLPALNHAATIYFLVAGSDKAKAVQDTITPAGGVSASPASRVRSIDGTVTWWVDNAAAADSL